MLQTLAVVSVLGVLLCLVLPLHAATSTIIYEYDNLNRLTNATYAGGAQERFSHDPAGNRTQGVTAAALTRLDGIAPTVPANLTLLTVASNQAGIAWGPSTDSGGAGLAGYLILVNGVAYTNASGTNLLLRGLVPDTSYILTLLAFDGLTNQSLQSTQLTLRTLSGVDNLPPVLTVLPANGSILTTNLLILSGTASDAGRGDSGIAAVTVSGKNAANDSAAGGSTANWSYPLSLLPGSNSFRLVAQDASPNLNATTQMVSLFYAMPSNLPPFLVASPTVNAAPPGLTLYGATNAAYQLAWSTNLTNWVALPDRLIPTNGSVLFVDFTNPLWNRLFYRASLVGPASTSVSDDFNRPDSTNVGNGWSNLLDSGTHRLVIRDQRLTTQTYLESTPGAAGVFRSTPRALPITLSARLTYMNASAGLPYRYTTQIGILSDGKLDTGYRLIFSRSDSNYSNSKVCLNDGLVDVANVASSFQFQDEIVVSATFNADGSIMGSVQGDGQTFPFSFPAYGVQSTGTNVFIRLDMPDARATGYTYTTVDDFKID